MESNGVRYDLNRNDAMLRPAGLGSFSLVSTQNVHSGFILIRAPSLLNETEVLNFESANIKYYLTRGESPKSNLGRLFVWGRGEVDVGSLARELIARGERLVSAPLAMNGGISGTMFVLRGESGCHRHMRSDYLAFNAIGGSLQHIRHPFKFETQRNDAVVMPLEYVHNLFSHASVGNDTVNVMLLFQFPAQTSSDSENAQGCMSP